MCVCVGGGGGMLDVPALSGILWSCCGGWVGVWHFVELLWGMGGCVAFCGVAVGDGWVGGILWSCCGGWVGVWHFVELLWGMGGCVAFCGVAVGGGWVCGWGWST